MKYCGINLHSNNSVVIVNDEDRIVFNKRLPNDLGQIRAALEPHQEELAGVVIESTYNWYWLVDGLMDTSYRCIWPTRLRSRSTRGSSIAGISLMQPIWRSC